MKPSFDLDRLAELARLELTAEERHAYLRDMEALVAFADTLGGESEPIDNTSQFHFCSELRADIPAPCTPRHELLQSSATHTEQFFTVPKTVAQEGSHE